MAVRQNRDLGRPVGIPGNSNWCDDFAILPKVRIKSSIGSVAREQDTAGINEAGVPRGNAVCDCQDLSIRLIRHILSSAIEPGKLRKYRAIAAERAVTTAIL